MLNRLLRGFVLLAFVAGLISFTPPAPAASKGLSPEAFLNPDGTLKLDGSFSGAFDLEGWDVQLDPALGPVLSPIAALDNWAALASGGGAFNSYINAILVNGTDVYVGGDFRDAGGNPEADYIAMWDGSTWTALGNNGSGNGALSSKVYALGLYGGVLYVGGEFTTYDPGGSPIADATKLAVWDGAWMEVTGITSPLNGGVSAFGFDSTNNILYFGGGFTNVNGDGTADNIAGIDFDTSALVTLGSNGAGDGSLNSFVTAIAVNSSGSVYAGGAFTNVNNGGTSIPEADRIAEWDGANWSALGSNGSGDGALAGAVRAIAIDGSSNVYAGGEFNNAAGIAEADLIAKWNGSSWSALGSDGAGNGALVNAGGGIYEIAINGTDVYAGGYFTGSSGIPTADYAARFNTGSNTWVGLGSNGAGNGSLRASVLGMAYSGGTLYVGGLFWDVSNSGTNLPTADYFATWNGTDWSTLGDSNGGMSQSVQAIAVIGTDVYVGGPFQNFGGDARMDFLVRWDGSAWNPVGNLTQTTGSVNSTVSALAVDGTDLYVGGSFTTVSNEGSAVVGTTRIAKWNGSTWSALGSGLNADVWALAVDASHNVYAGGLFTDAASISEADYIAKWNGASWSSLAGNGASNGALNSYVKAIAVSGSNVYVGGGFTSAVDTSNTAIPNAAYLAKWNGSVWSAMDGITTPLTWDVNALAISGSDLYVGGRFWDLNGISAADRIAKWDGTNWSALGSNGAGDGPINLFVHAIAVSGSHVYVGGTFTNVNNGSTSIPEADYVARWDGSDWSALGDNGSGNGSLNNNVYALRIVNFDLWVGGDFTNVNNGGTTIKEADFLAAYGLDSTAPTVTSIVRANANPTSAASVNFTVTFSESVTGVGTGDFSLTTTGVSGATVSGVSGSGATRTVTVGTGTANGTIRLNVRGTATINDLAGNPISGVPYTSGEIYTVVRNKLTIRSNGTYDGWVLESTETSGVGGSMNNADTTFRLGDGTADKQYRSILHFNTAPLPDTAVITKVTLKIRKQGLTVGADPFTILGALRVDIRKPFFGAGYGLALGDFQALATKNSVGTIPNTPASGWYSKSWTSGIFSYINLTGPTQFRLRFATDDNDDNGADYMKFYSGNYAGVASRPTLIIEYYIP